MPAKVDKESCVGCGTCVDECPEAAIEMKEINSDTSAENIANRDSTHAPKGGCGESRE